MQFVINKAIFLAVSIISFQAFSNNIEALQKIKNASLILKT